MERSKRIVALAAAFRRLAGRDEALHRKLPTKAEQIEAAKIAAERAEALKELFAIVTDLTQEKAAVVAEKDAIVEKRTEQAKDAGELGGAATQAGVAAGDIRPPRRAKAPKWPTDAPEPPSIEWRTTWDREVQRRYLVALDAEIQRRAGDADLTDDVLQAAAAEVEKLMPTILKEVAAHHATNFDGTPFKRGVKLATLRRAWYDEEQRKAILTLPMSGPRKPKDKP